MSYKLLSPTYYTRFKTIDEFIGSGKRLLDVGCGDGEYDYYLHNKFKTIVGVDINNNELLFAKRNKLENTNYVLSEGAKLPFSDETFDKVICIDVLEHVANDKELISEIYRVLEKRGSLLLSVANKNYPWTYDPINYFLGLFFKRHVPIGIWGFGHLRIYDIKQIKEMLEKEGFKIEKEEYLSHYLAGIFENYLSTLLQPFLKFSPSDRSKEGRRSEVLKKRDAPEFFKKIIRTLVNLDEKIFKNSKTSVGLLVKARRE